MLARITLVLAVVALSITSLGTPAAAALQPWDQEKVAALGRELYEAMRDTRQTTLRNPSMRDFTAGRVGQQYLDTLKSLEQSTRQLSNRLANGDGREETLGTARRIGTLLRDAQTLGRQLMTSQGEWNDIERVITVLDQISPFYSETSPLMPNPMNPS